MIRNNQKFILLLFVICAGLLLFSSISFAQDHDSTFTTDAETAAELGLLVGEGNGVTAKYLSKSSTRIQAAIISLRLQGKLQEALNYSGENNFSDADQVNPNNQAILAYLIDHPEYGWLGTGNGSFDPLSHISSQQLYKVLLEVMGYRTGDDFTYADTEKFAENKGLSLIKNLSTLKNEHIATALVESLTAKTTEDKTLFTKLQTDGVITQSSLNPEGQRIALKTDQELGTYFTDQDGRTLYFFTKDAEDPNSCQDNCLQNWPTFYSEHVQLPPSLKTSDFSTLHRSDGTEQITYKGWPLYYFKQDIEPGDIKGEAVGDVWFIVNPNTFNGTTASERKTYHIDIKDYSFGTELLTVEAGSTIVFTNYDDVQHNAVAVDGNFSTPLLNNEESYKITMDTPGTYEYFCEPHKKFMQGQIIVK